MSEASKHAPDHPEVIEFQSRMFRRANEFYMEGKTAMEAGDFEGGTEWLSKALQVTPDDMKVRLLRAVAFRKRSLFIEALRDLDAAVRLSSCVDFGVDSGLFAGEELLCRSC